MNISFFDVTDDEHRLFKSLIRGHRLTFFHESLTKKNIAVAVEADCIYVRSFSQITKGILSKLPNLRFIATRSTGFDNIDIDECRRRKIMVSNVPSYARNAVAEHTFGLLLTLAHSIVQGVQSTRTGSFVEGPQGFDITAKTLGVVGFGNIGTRVVEIAKGFGMRVFVNTRYPKRRSVKIQGVRFVDFPTLLQKCDIVSFHVPLTEETHHMLNRKNIMLLRRGSILLNTSRGEVVETKAIVWALSKGILRAAGLDVLENERELKTTQSDCIERRLMKDERVLVTPHNAYHSKEAIDTILRISAENILAFLNHKPIHSVV